MFVSVILSTYNSPDWLTKAVLGYSVQTHRDFEIVIADDGSDANTQRRIEQLRCTTTVANPSCLASQAGLPEMPDLNCAILASTAQYLLFSDGDCIPARDFIAQHVRFAAPGRLLSGAGVSATSA